VVDFSLASNLYRKAVLEFLSFIENLLVFTIKWACVSVSFSPDSFLEWSWCKP